MKEIWVCVKESGDRIEKVSTFEEGLKLVERFEDEDKKEGVYEECFYEVVEC